MLFAARNRELANKWFVEPAWNARSLADVWVSITAKEMERYPRIADEAYKLTIFPQPAKLKEHVDDSIARKVDAEVWDFDVEAVKILK